MPPTPCIPSIITDEIVFPFFKKQSSMAASSLNGRKIYRIKFDDEAPVKWSMAEASDNSSDVLFFNNENKFVDKLKKSKKVKNA